jgi:hypothetical protein
MSLIIGAGGNEAPVLPEADVDLPPPTTAPEARFVLTEDAIRGLFDHSDPLVRQYAVEQVVHRRLDALASLLVDRIADDPMVAVPAVRGLAELKSTLGVDAMVERFSAASGDLLIALASGLATLAPDRLLPAIKGRGRIDDAAFPGVMSAVAIVRDDDAHAYLDRALTRAGLLHPERRSALYNSALLSGAPRPTKRVLSMALSDSTGEPPEGGGVAPSRVALALVAGGSGMAARPEAAPQLWAMTDDTLRSECEGALAPDAYARLEQALPRRQLDEILDALAPLLDLPPLDVDPDDDELGTMPERRRGLLEQLVRMKDQFRGLNADAAALFAAASARAVAVMMAVRQGDADSPGVATIVKASEGRLSPALLLDAPEDELAARFREMGARALRPVAVALGRERFRRAGTLRRLARTLLAAEQGVLLFEAAAESPDGRVHEAVVRAAMDQVPAAEAAALELLSASPLDEKAGSFAILVAEELRTERLALVLGRRFYSIRPLDRTMAAQAVLRIGDPRLLPLLASRAYEHEPEETAWVVLAHVFDQPTEGKLGAATERVRDDVQPTGALQVPMRCSRCGEVLSYAFEQAYVDVEAKDEFGDPAFVGDQVCKACGAEDSLLPTADTAQILTAHMMQLLEAMQTGHLSERPLVAPAQTEVGGRSMGMAKAMRELAEQIDASPDAIRPRLHRARLGLLLRRSTVEEDLARVESVDPSSVEVRALRAHQLNGRGERDAAMEALASVVQDLSRPDEPRLYDAPDAATLRSGLEDLMLELSEDGSAVPQGIDLGAAEQRRTERERAAAQAQAQAGAPHSH